jgi:hemerythrin-like domain-containing protein
MAKKTMAKTRKKKTKRTAVGARAKQNLREPDITALMLRDHKPLKSLIEVMKDPDARMAELRSAFGEFAPLLEAHAHPEQESLYGHLKADEESEMRQEGFEGFTEHHIADSLVEEIKALTDDDDWRAHVKVLAELVEHHIEEEEEEMIPDIRKELDQELRDQIGEDYLERRAQYRISLDEAA